MHSFEYLFEKLAYFNYLKYIINKWEVHVTLEQNEI